MFGYTLVLVSALFHSLWNILLKKSDNKYFYNFYMHLANFIIFSFAYVIFFRRYLYLDKITIFVAFIASTFFTFYHLFLSTAYNYDDISKLYPVTTVSPLFVTLWAVLFLKEKIDIVSFIGIIFIIFGVVIIGNIKNIKISRNKGIIYALLAAFAYSLGAIIDKLGVSSGNFILYVYTLTFFMTLYMFIFNRNYVKGNSADYFKKNVWKIFLGGGVLFFSFLTYRYGLKMVNVSYATALRQVNTIFGIFWGYVFFKEKITIYKIIGTVFIGAGVSILKFYV
ncbi:EamA family transporter [Deferribacter autotrophicus]|uniref:EamA family transporter n=1 Tax=Deferribacter autotrophicus TaxID=500465 RepID=A0A5A8F376_9BACT|nr:DMT family transporter [Deferribacter autotrophicus]KAA0257966.1 EamA family transporter [Deferribacter autotrophicus]